MQYSFGEKAGFSGKSSLTCNKKSKMQRKVAYLNHQVNVTIPQTTEAR